MLSACRKPRSNSAIPRGDRMSKTAGDAYDEIALTAA
jgi:hypothetical protein